MTEKVTNMHILLCELVENFIFATFLINPTTILREETHYTNVLITLLYIAVQQKLFNYI